MRVAAAALYFCLGQNAKSKPYCFSQAEGSKGQFRNAIDGLDAGCRLNLGSFFTMSDIVYRGFAS